MEKLKIFISWSGERSRSVAEAHREWLPNVFQMVDPWISAADIAKGAKWRHVLTSELEKSNFGLICLTPENLISPWLLFEAGALAKKEESLVWTYLLDLKPEDVKEPLSQFEHTMANEDDTWRLIETINRALPSGASLELERLKKIFQKWWPDLNDKLTGIPKPSGPALPERSDSDKISEILNGLRRLESVLVTREVENAATALAGIHEELREARELAAFLELLRAQLARLMGSADALSEAGERSDEYKRIQAQIAKTKADIGDVEARIYSAAARRQSKSSLGPLISYPEPGG